MMQITHSFNSKISKHLIKLLAAALLSTGLSSCSPFNYTESDAPVALSTIPVFSPKPKIALVLGAGGPRGYAHVGVMRVLEEAGIEVNLIVGSSVGSVLGAFWASGLSAEEIDWLSMEGGPLTLFDPNPFADRGWIRGQRLQDYVNKQLDNAKIEEFPRKVIVVTTQCDTKEPRFFIDGNVGVAVRASSAVPDIISPVGINGIEYEDGDVSFPLAVSAAKAAGAKFIIAVNVYPKKSSTPADASQESRKRDERRRRQIKPEVAKADFLIHPDTPYHAGPRRSFFEASRQIGEEEAKRRLPALLQALKKKFPD